MPKKVIELRHEICDYTCMWNGIGDLYQTRLDEDIPDYFFFCCSFNLCKWKCVEILEGHMMPDHIHILISISPKISVSSFMGYLKGKSVMMIFDRHSNLKYKFGNRHFGADGYYVSTVCLNEKTIAKYIREQEKYDQMMDKIT